MAQPATTTTPAAAATPAAAPNATAAPAAANQQGAGAGAPSYNSASLYVGDLHSDVAESQLFEKFNPVGAVASIRVCRDVATRRSLGYAYVNFHNGVDARRALDTLNNTPIKGKPCRIMWSQRDPSVRKSGVGNVFIKNLDKSIDHATLFETFQDFGNILSCKVSLDDAGKSKGYGFVHFETQQAADEAIQKTNGKLLAESKIFVGPFIPRKERPPAGSHKFTNVYLKDLDESVTVDQLNEILGKFGEITSTWINTPNADAPVQGKRFGFVNFETPEAASDCVNALNGKPLVEGQKPIYVGRAQKKAERDQELRQKFERLTLERAAKYQGVNLYVKNLDDDMNDEKLRAEFVPFGEITSCTVMRDDKNNSKGFGFVCFKTPEEATRAINEMNSKMILNKPLYVALAQRKEIRRAQLEATYAARQKGIHSQVGPQLYPTPGAPPVFYPTHSPQQFVYPPQMVPRGGNRWPAQPNYQHPMGYAMGGVRQQAGQPQQPRHGHRQLGGPGGRRAGGAGGNFRGGRPEPQPAAAGEDTLSAKIANTPPSEHFNMVGENLFPLVEKMHPEHAGKITGMLLDRYNNTLGDLVSIMENQEQLNASVSEAMKVLQESLASS